MQLVVHSPYGSRLNRAWGLALRKRFCATFNFEIQAAATEDNIVISLTEAHSFGLADVPRYLHSNIGARRADPGGARFADVHHALALGERRVARPAALPRRPQGAAAAHAHGGRGPGRLGVPRPDRLRREPARRPRDPRPSAGAARRCDDCLNEAMDIEGLERLLKGIESGEVEVVTRELTQPSPLAIEVLSARPYAFLDDAPLEERRTQAVMARRWLAPEQASELGRLDPEAIARVRGRGLARCRQRRRAARCAGLAGLPDRRRGRGQRRLARLAGRSRRARSARRGSSAPARRCGSPRSDCRSSARCGPAARRSRPLPRRRAMTSRLSSDEALVELLRGRLEGLGPVTAAALAAPLGCSEIAAGLATLEAEGFAMRGRFSAGRDRRRMVRAPPAGAHPSLHDQAAARGDRAGGRARLPALPVPLAARRARGAHGRREGARRHHRAARRLRRAGRRVGERDFAGAPRRLRAELARCALPRRAGDLDAAALARWPQRRRAAAAPVRTTPITLSPRRHVGAVALAVAGRWRRAQRARRRRCSIS